MKHTFRTNRLLALALAVIMVIAMFPASVFAAGTTIVGSPETVKLGSDAAAQRVNDFNMGWKFYLGDNSNASSQNFDDSAWDNVNLPHDFSIIQHFTASGEAESGFLPGGTGWYRKSFVISEEAAGKTFLLNFDGAYKDTYVFVNGTFVGEHHYGYSNFAFDISEHLVCDGATQNVVAVKVVNQLPSSRWYSGSGIYRDVTLYALDPVHVDLHGVTVTTPDIADGDGTAAVKVDVINDGKTAANVTVKATVLFAGEPVAEGTTDITAAAGAVTEATLGAEVENPALWSVDEPNLYTLKTEILVNGDVVDSCEETFGFRWFSWSEEGFALNGENVKLNGVCLHHDQGALGAAAYYDAMYRQLSIMKEMGCNAIRTSHNPADEQFIEICSELGLLVIEEAFDGLTRAKNSNYNDFSTHFNQTANPGLYGYAEGMTCAEYAARSMMKRDRNAPSIIAWSMGNEIQEGASTGSEFVTVAQNFVRWSNAVDGTRPVTIGDNTRGGNSTLVSVINTLTGAGGIAGFNYANSASTLYSLSQSYGGSKGVIIASETSSATNSRGQYRNQNNNSSSDSAYHLTSYDTSSVGWGITAHDSIYNTYQYDCVAGEFVWTGFDYIGEPTPWNGTGTGTVDGGSGATPNSSYFGIVETTGFPKDTYYLYRSQWNKADTTVHLVTAWDSENMMTDYSGKTPVWVYTNAAKVELYLKNELIGTTVRTPVTSSAGHTYYTYSATSNNTSVCTAAGNSDADALYTIFNVAYTAGTLTAKAFDENGTLVDTYSVTTPGSVTKLMATADKTKINANGYDLVYVEVDVTDADGNLKTTATNNITFTLSGPGEIAGVDNGNQATVRKYQNDYVLTSKTTANINAYAGKALVIIRSTEEAGTITLNIESSDLTSQTVTINTASDTSSAAEGLVSYTMVRDYTVKVGTLPTLQSAATGTLTDGSTISGSIEWEAISEAVYCNAGDYTVSGTASFDGYDDIRVSARLHVIPNIIDLRNVSAAVMEGNAPALPDTVRGVMADGTLAGEFTVEWDEVDAAQFNTVGDLVTVNGTAVIFGNEIMDVTCTVRVAEAVNTESKNVAPAADTLTQDVSVISDNLASILNGVLKPGDNTDERWTNYYNRTNSANATLTLTWATAQMVSGVNLYYYDDGCSGVPESVEFSYSLNGQEYTVIGHTAEQIETYYLGALYTYTFDEPINPVGLKVKLTQQNGTSGTNCVGLTELEVMTYAAGMTVNTSADLSGIAVDGTAIDGFSANILTYEADGFAVTASTAVNAGITVLPAYEGVVRILTVSEDGSAAKTYEVTVGESEPACKHTNTVIRDTKTATCTEEGYTGDTYCTDCGEMTVRGETVPATGHRNTEVRDAEAATCTEAGYTGDTYCTDCNTKIADGAVIAAKGHSWDSGVITQPPTETAPGVKTFTCTVCSATKTEDVEYQATPSVSLTLSTNSSGRIVIKGQIDNFENMADCYEITGRGILYIQTSRIGTRTLTVNTSGRTRVNFSTVSEEGTFTYNLKPTSKGTSYAFRAFVIYKNTETGKTVTVYSDMIRGSYNSLNKG